MISAQNENAIVAGADELCENSSPLRSLILDGKTWWNEGLHTQSRSENEC